MAPKIAVTGPPGVGKSTVIHNVIEISLSYGTVESALAQDVRWLETNRF